MSLQRQILFWLSAFAFVTLLLYVLQGVLLPFAAGMVLAYLLDPVADWFEAKGLNRVLASSLILSAAVLLAIMAALVLLPILGRQLTAFAENVPGYLAGLEKLLETHAGKWLSPLMGANGTETFNNNISMIVTKGASWLTAVIKSLWSGGLALVNLVSLLGVTPIVAFYMLVDWDRMIASIDSWLPRDHAETVRELARDINQAIAGFIRGQGMVCLLLGLFYAIGLTLTGLNFGLLIGFGAGLISFIPYVGSIVGLVVSMGVAIVQFWPDWSMMLAVLVVFGAGQFLEGNILSPKLVGTSVGLHPVWLMFALFAFGYLFGFTGMLVAVPLAAMIGVIVRFLLRQYLNSPIYTGHGGQKD